MTQEKVDILLKRTEILKNEYLETIKKWSSGMAIDEIALSIPKTAAPYQFHLSELLSVYSDLENELDELYYNETFNYKIANSELANIDLNSSELRRMIETSPKYRAIKNQSRKISDAMKVTEEMLQTIKNYGFNLQAVIKWREFIRG